MDTLQYDIIIIGGGMVGASLACALRTSKLSVALIDAAPPAPNNNDPRLIALNYTSYCLFKNLQLWGQLHAVACAINTVHVSHRGHFGITKLTAEEASLPTLGYVVPAKYINHALYNALAENKNITLIRPAKLKHIIQNNDESVIVSIETPEGKKILSGKILVGADGSHSTVRELLDIPTQQTSNQQSAIVTITHLQRAHKNIAYERFLENGAIAMMPLINAPDSHTVAAIWTDKNTVIEHLQTLSDAEFLQHLQKKFGYRLGRLQKIEERFSFPLHWIYAKQQIKQRAILLGNALHTLPPIAAQGLNLALFEIAVFTEYLLENALGSTLLENFSLPQPQISKNLSHALNWLFSNNFPMLNTARQLGMVGLDNCLALKKYFTWQAMGQSGNIPSLLT